MTATGHIELTERAARRIAKVMEKESGKTALRISVEGGGCSGFSYKFNLVSDQNDDDTVVTRNGATVLIDAMSLPFMDGSEIDFVDDLMGQSFKINNPNATASCGCGTSFAV
ncbi:iron-sulfur cluster insertion protein ErpA [Oryzibacter oryziterrae]|uniref:iron-sulfur cluster insertion protein ErpA n=1 Tax=Oryzibacter oryziterrae TaxID=2766474 RepID=UPI001F02CFC7|nr:iron-sulfur cluster insertion protein ErpA [Oryzibacter oryziterrae]